MLKWNVSASQGRSIVRFKANEAIPVKAEPKQRGYRIKAAIQRIEKREYISDASNPTIGSFLFKLYITHTLSDKPLKIGHFQ